jgi:hypothetical protein
MGGFNEKNRRINNLHSIILTNGLSLFTPIQIGFLSIIENLLSPCLQLRHPSHFWHDSAAIPLVSNFSKVSDQYWNHYA